MERDEYRRMFSVEDVHWWYVSLHELVLETVRREYDRKGPLSMLDAGCGTGRLLQLLSAYGPVQGCDDSGEALELCRTRGLERLRKADLSTADLGREQFDIITLIDVLYHRHIQDEAGVLERIYTALKPGGMAIVQVPAWEFLRSSHDTAVHTRRRYQRRELVRLLEQSGFAIEKATCRVALLFAPIVLYRLVRKWISRGENGTIPRSDAWLPGSRTNDILAALLKVENRLLRAHSLPFGTSVYVVAKKLPETRKEPC